MTSFDDYRATFDSDPGYLNWAAFGPLSPTVRAEVFADADLLGSGRPSSLALIAERIGQAREIIGDLLGMSSESVTMQPSSTQGLLHAFFGLEGAVLASDAEFPSIRLTLDRVSHARRGAVAPRWLATEHGFVTPEAVADALDDDVVALAVSHVDFRTGYRADLVALRDVIGPDRLLIVDAVQSFGIVDDDLSVADVVVGHGYKWLRAGRGSGFAAFSDNARERIVPVLSGFAGAQDGPIYDEVLPPASSAQAYVVSPPDQLAVARLVIGAGDVRKAGVADIAAAVSAHVEGILEIADKRGIPILTPRDPARRAGIVALLPSSPAAFSAALANAGVVGTTRGPSVRLAPHVGTCEETLRMLDEAIGSLGR